MKNNKGFTLIEMLVVVGIIVILTGAVAISIVQNVQKSRDIKTKVELHYTDGYNNAKAQVMALKSAGYGGSGGATATPTPSPTPGGTTTAPTPTPTTATTATPTPTSTPTPTPTPMKVGNYTVPQITGEPAPFPNTTTAITSGTGGYDFNAAFTVPSRSYATYAAIYLPPGTIGLIEWKNCVVEAFDPVTNIAVISIGAGVTKPSIHVDYPGAKVDWTKTKIFDIAQKT